MLIKRNFALNEWQQKVKVTRCKHTACNETWKLILLFVLFVFIPNPWVTLT